MIVLLIQPCEGYLGARSFAWPIKAYMYTFKK